MKPKYDFFKNAKYGASGLKLAFKNETSFKIEVVLVVVLSVVLLFLKVPAFEKIVVFGSMFIVLITELLNSSIEVCVDLYTKEFNTLAKAVKDTAAGAVFLSILLSIATWSVVLIENFF